MDRHETRSISFLCQPRYGFPYSDPRDHCIYRRPIVDQDHSHREGKKRSTSWPARPLRYIFFVRRMCGRHLLSLRITPSADGRKKKKCWACHDCNTVRPPPSPLSPHPPLRLPAGVPSPSLPSPPPHALCEARRFPSRKKYSIATSTTGLCVECSKHIPGVPSRLGRMGQRKRKIARFPCDRHPIEIGGGARHRPGAMPCVPTASSTWAGVSFERGCVGGRGTLESENLGLLYWCRSGHRVPGHRPERLCCPSSVCSAGATLRNFRFPLRCFP
ncbi:hypothetical protein EDB87DRAFT_1738977 [Lactarius vividus]|nr:hypothetical protein EDB87DRAFT_1738977 [Lactarius vividus]